MCFRAATAGGVPRFHFWLMPVGWPKDFGDEPLAIAREAGVPVFVAAERYDAGLLAEAIRRSAAKYRK